MLLKFKTLTPQDLVIGQFLVSIVQLFIAALMLWSLFQASKNISYTRMQLEAMKLPSIEILSLAKDGLRLLNSGDSETVDFQIIAHLSAYWQETTEEVTHSQLVVASITAQPIRKRLLPGEEFVVDLDQVTATPVGVPARLDEHEAFSVVVRYYRAVDRKRFFKIVSFLREASEGPSGIEYSYFPLYVLPGSTIVQTKKPVLLKLRKNLRELCAQDLDIKMQDDVP